MGIGQGNGARLSSRVRTLAAAAASRRNSLSNAQGGLSNKAMLEPTDRRLTSTYWTRIAYLPSTPAVPSLWLEQGHRKRFRRAAKASFLWLVTIDKRIDLCL